MISRIDPKGVRFACLWILASVLLPPSGASAADPAALEQLIRQGNEMRLKGSDQAALPFFKRAYDLLPSPRTAAQLGLVELALGYSIQSEVHLGEALSSPHHLWVAKNREKLEAALVEARKAIGRIEIGGSPVGAKISVNASVVGTLPLAEPVRVSEGTAQIVVGATGYNETTLKVRVAGGATERVVIDLLPNNRAEPISKSTSRSTKSSVTRSSPLSTTTGSGSPPSGAWVRPASWVAATLSLGAFGLAVVSFLKAKQNGDAFNAKLRPGTQDHACDVGFPDMGPSPCAAWAHDHESAQRLGYAGVTGGLLLGAMATMGFLWSHDRVVDSVSLSTTVDGWSANWQGRF